jgi:hypothetical protein
VSLRLGLEDHHLAIELARALMDHDVLAEAWAIFDRIRDEGGDGTPGWLVGFQACNVLTGNFGAFEDVMSSIRRLPRTQRRLVKAEIMDEVARISARWLEPEPVAPVEGDRAGDRSREGSGGDDGQVLRWRLVDRKR